KAFVNTLSWSIAGYNGFLKLLVKKSINRMQDNNEQENDEGVERNSTV
ncbi:15326_t:CDS:2, partial [Funneliformis caledonium]